MAKITDIFDVWYGVNLEVVNCEIVDRDIPFVSRQSVNNGVVCHVLCRPSEGANKWGYPAMPKMRF